MRYTEASMYPQHREKHLSSLDYGSTEDGLFENATQLNWGSVERNLYMRGVGNMNVSLEPFMQFTGCNTGIGEFAQNFANSQGVTTFAQPYSSSFSRAVGTKIPIDPWGAHFGVYNVTYTHG